MVVGAPVQLVTRKNGVRHTTGARGKEAIYAWLYGILFPAGIMAADCIGQALTR